MKAWYTLHSKPNAEYQVATALQQRGIEIFLPEIKARQAHGRRRRKPFFPCYLFCQVDFRKVGFSSVQWTPGLRRVVAFDDQPVPVPDNVIELVRTKLEELEGRGGLPTHAFKPGDTVRITKGPLQDMLAIFDGPTTPTQRVQVLLDMLGHASRVQLDVTDLEKAPPGANAPIPRRRRGTRGGGRRINYDC
jgi:transcriptional antiterminator RfaH